MDQAKGWIATRLPPQLFSVRARAELPAPRSDRLLGLAGVEQLARGEGAEYAFRDEDGDVLAKVMADAPDLRGVKLSPVTS
jgi:hypothetical protein